MGFFDDPFGFIMGKDQIDKDYDNCVQTCKSTKDAARAAKKANAAAPVQAEGAPATEGAPAQSGGRRRRKIHTKTGRKKAKKVKSTVKKARK
jgi:hypothetical protein